MKNHFAEFCSILLLAVPLIGCSTNSAASGERTGPAINEITTSGKSFSIDCVPTSITVTANITDPSGITRAVLSSRVGTDHPYTPVDMDHLSSNNFSATVKALDIPVGEYGVLEFYIVAEGVEGNQAKSKINTSVQLLPCVSN